MRMTRTDIKNKVMQRMNGSISLRGEQKADVTDMWEENEKALRMLFETDKWTFKKTDGKIYLQQREA